LNIKSIEVFGLFFFFIEYLVLSLLVSDEGPVNLSFGQDNCLENCSKPDNWFLKHLSGNGHQEYWSNIFFSLQQSKTENIS